MKTSHWPSLISSSAVAVIVGFASTILVVMEGARAVGATPTQQISVATSLCVGMAITTFFLAVRYRMPIITAWSTPGSVLIATSATGITFPEATGAFVAAGALMVLTAFVKPVSRAIAAMPATIAAAMLAGVLLHYVLGVPGAVLSSPFYGAPLVIAFFALRLLKPLYTVPLILVLGLALAAFAGSLRGAISFNLMELAVVVPAFQLQAIISLGLPLYLVTMASQNLPGFAVLRANGYQPPVTACLGVTGLASMLLAPFGSHAINLAAITASLVAGPEAHPDPQERWKVAYPYLVIYLLVGLAAATFVTVLGALPKDLVTIIAGLALFAPLLGAVGAMMREPDDIEAALVTFLVTASGISVGGIGAAFWGLLMGLAVWGVKRWHLSVR